MKIGRKPDGGCGYGFDEDLAPGLARFPYPEMVRKTDKGT
jgi:hypothetical protein